jgi:hypothetical protein
LPVFYYEGLGSIAGQHMKDFWVDKVALEQVFLRVLCFLLPVFIINIHLSLILRSAVGNTTPVLCYHQSFGATLWFNNV